MEGSIFSLDNDDLINERRFQTTRRLELHITPTSSHQYQKLESHAPEVEGNPLASSIIKYQFYEGPQASEQLQTGHIGTYFQAILSSK